MTKDDLARRLKALEPGCAFPIHECELAVTFGVKLPLSGAAVRTIRAFAWRRRCVLSYAPCDSGPAFLEKLQPDGDLPGFSDLSCYAGPGRF